MRTTSLYELNGIKRTVSGGRVILDIDRLALPDGMLTAIVGENGAGKSTLLKTLAFLEEPDRGEVCFRGKRVRARDFFELRRSVTMVDQSPLLFHGSVFKNVAYGLKVRGVPRSEWGDRVEEALSLVDLAGLGRRTVKGLSGGETQRVAIARSLVFRPEVVLLDEPTAGVDAARVEMIETLIRDLNTRAETSIVFSTHNLAQAYRLTDHVIHISAGRTIQSGMENLFSGHADSENGLHFIRLRSGVRIVASEGRSGSIRFTVPSSHIELVPLSEKGDGANRYEGTITRMELRGPRIRLRLSGELNLRVEMDPEQAERRKVRLGSRVAAVIPPEAVKIID
jgi:tungstate transport system ATP-binding protein